MKLHELDISSIRDATVFLDVDGTLVSDHHAQPSPEALAAALELKKYNDVYLASNGHYKRIGEMSKLLDIPALPRLRKPFPHRVLRSITRRERTIVIGDKFLTDGLFARVINAEYMPLLPLRGDAETYRAKVAYVVDGMVISLIKSVNTLFASTPWQYVRLIRPKQWIKNVLLLTPLFFAGEFFTLSQITAAALGFVTFSAAASAGYVVNDLFDRTHDRKHPKKKNRPLASGRIRPAAGIVVAVLLLLIAGYAASLVPAVIPWVLTYFVLTIVYSAFLKKVPVLELLTVGVLFVTRILAGGAVITVPLSSWIILTTFFAALFVTAGKRYSESEHDHVRAVVRKYPKEFLSVLPAMGALLSILSFALYTILGTPHPLMVYSNIFVVFGILWYLFGIYNKKAESPEDKLWGDLVLLGTVAVWGFFLVGIYYGPLILSYVP